ncbi:DNA-directed RNA polymerase I subunit RPA34.5-domain-containing protein [Podospora didyma]|uniref:DNA-directed RNA polymerase I subunit RPA34.5-domain-containing protein n=1 Tax=Podospora didyma TaxID=330526 RepID=A0AAE0TZ90_9PEZI|nr:DNA-directed RNA polymerase I subunit RPA34.5-domain-containing protein [Podospora didyma]
MAPGGFTRRAGESNGKSKHTTKNAKKASDDSESESDSHSDSGSGSDSYSSRDASDGGGKVNTTSDAWAAKLRASSSALQSRVNASQSSKATTTTIPSNETKTDMASSNNKDEKAGKKSRKDTSDSDSDSSAESFNSEEEMPTAKVNAAKKGTKTKTAAKPDSDSDSGSESESESGSGSDSDSGSSDDEEVELAKKPLNKAGAKSKAAKSSSSASDSESSSEGSSSKSEAEKKAVPKAKAASKVSKAKSSSTSKSATKTYENGFKSHELVRDSESDVSMVDKEAASSSESDSDKEDGESMAVDKVKANSTVPGVAPEIISPNFYLRKAEDHMDASDVAHAFHDAKAHGKQIWFFTMPASVPVEVIQQHSVPLDKLQAGKPMFAHDGADYTGEFQEAAGHTIKVFIPASSGKKYKMIEEPLDQVLHIKRVTRFGDESTQPPAALPPVLSSKPPRAQPKGLKPRNFPIGVPGGITGKIGTDTTSDSSEDVEMSQAPPFPSSTETPKNAAKKRKHEVIEKGTPDKGAPSASAKKTKKARVDSSAAPSQGTPAKPVKQTPIAPPQIPSTTPTDSVKKPSSRKDKSVETPAKSSQFKTINNLKSASKKVTPVLPPVIPSMKST